MDLKKSGIFINFISHSFIVLGKKINVLEKLLRKITMVRLLRCELPAAAGAAARAQDRVHEPRHQPDPVHAASNPVRQRRRQVARRLLYVRSVQIRVKNNFPFLKLLNELNYSRLSFINTSFILLFLVFKNALKISIKP